MDAQPADHITARLVGDAAHATRNHVATVLAAARLADDPELAEALREAGTALQQAIDRTIAAARVELSRLGDVVELPLEDALAAGARRAAREGWIGRIDPEAAAAISGAGSVQAPGVQLERLLADLLHGGGSEAVQVSCSRHADEVVLRLSRGEGWPTAAVRTYLEALAAACGACLDARDPSVSQLRLAVSPGT